MLENTTWSRMALIVTGVLAMGGCGDTPAAPLDDLSAPRIGAATDADAFAASRGAPLQKDVRQWIRHLRSETRGFRDFAEAPANGWVAQLSPCVESPTGGMGYHYGNPALIDGQLDALRPEILLYEPQRKGGVRFVGVEFIVPFGAWTEANPPEVQGVALHPNEELGLWVLHVWTERHNPAGVFEDFNPLVSCEFAPSPQ